MRLKDYKKLSKLRTINISNYTSTSRSYISLVENHRQKPSKKLLLLISQLFSEYLEYVSYDQIEYDLLTEFGYKPLLDELNIDSLLRNQQAIFQAPEFNHKKIVLTEQERRIIRNLIITIVRTRRMQ